MTEVSDPSTSLRSTDEADVYSALIKIGKAEERTREGEVAAFLQHASPQLRSAAIRVLGFYWGLPDYREHAAHMVRTETDEDARAVAIMAWCSYYRDTKEPVVLRELFALFNEKSLRRNVRHAAYSGMMVVAGIPGPERARALAMGPFDESIDWELVRRMLDGTGVDLPTDAASVASTLGVRRVVYDWGEAHAPGLDVGHIVLTFNGETLMVELLQERGPTVRAWQAMLPLETWNNLVETLHRYEFPKPAVVVEPLVPGSTFKTISWERRGQVETLNIAGRPPDYRDVNRIVFSIVSQMVPGMLPGKPTDWEFPKSRVELPFEVKGDIEKPRRS